MWSTRSAAVIYGIGHGSGKSRADIAGQRMRMKLPFPGFPRVVLGTGLDLRRPLGSSGIAAEQGTSTLSSFSTANLVASCRMKTWSSTSLPSEVMNCYGVTRRTISYWPEEAI
jgi:hypothetical protein